MANADIVRGLHKLAFSKLATGVVLRLATTDDKSSDTESCPL